MAQKVDQELRRRKLAMAAMRLISQVGYDNVSLIMIAEAIGLSRTAIYRLYNSKRQVFDAAIVYVSNDLAAECTRIALGRESTVIRLEKVCRKVVEVLFANRAFVTAIFDVVLASVRTGSDMTPTLKAFTTGTRSVIAKLVAHGKKRGEFAPILIEERVVDVLYAGFESCAQRILLGSESTPEAAYQRIADMIKAIACWR